VFELLIGLGLIVLSLSAKGTFHWGSLTGRQTSPAIEPRWIPRLILLLFALVAILDGISQIRHKQMVSIGPDQKVSAVIYFRKEITEQQVEDFRSTVLKGHTLPGRDGLDYPAFVSLYLRLIPSQANDHWAIALTFLNNAPPDNVNAYLATIKADSRVETVFLNTAPNSIHADSKHL